MASRLSHYARSLAMVIKQLGMRDLLTALTSQAEFSQLIRPLGQRPLIISPHPGDDVMAMGGTMAAYAEKDIPLVVLTVTTGVFGTNTGRRQPRLGPKRQKEALRAFSLFGEVVRPTFWSLEEKFSPTPDLSLTLLEIIDDLNPDIIYLPSLLDNHPDSQAAMALLIEALKGWPSPRLRQLLVGQYELWTPIVPNKILSIDAYEATKTKAIQCHESQLLCRNYLDAMLGLNRYRAAMLGAGSVAEAFCICSAQQYLVMSRPKGASVVEMVG